MVIYLLQAPAFNVDLTVSPAHLQHNVFPVRMVITFPLVHVQSSVLSTASNVFLKTFALYVLRTTQKLRPDLASPVIQIVNHVFNLYNARFVILVTT